MVESALTPSLDEANDPLDEYRSVERWAVAGLLLGMLSSSAMLDSILWLLPPLGILINLIALGRIRRDASRVGRKAALAGLALSVTFAVAPVAQWASAYAILWRQGTPVADQWFEFLREGEPEKVLMLRFSPDMRQGLDEDLWLYFRSDKDARGELQGFVRNPTVRTLLALGPRAEARYYKTSAVATEGGRAIAEYIYTVTYSEKDGKKKTFLLSVLAERKPTKRPGLHPWRVLDVVSRSDRNKSKT